MAMRQPEHVTTRTPFGGTAPLLGVVFLLWIAFVATLILAEEMARGNDE
jgi:hypothetical protein